VAAETGRNMLLFNPTTAPFYAQVVDKLQSGSPKFVTELSAAPVNERGEIESAIEAFAREPGGSLIAGADVFVVANRGLIIGLAEPDRLRAIYLCRQFAASGGLLPFRTDTAEIFRRSTS